MSGNAWCYFGKHILVMYFQLKNYTSYFVTCTSHSQQSSGFVPLLILRCWTFVKVFLGYLLIRALDDPLLDVDAPSGSSTKPHYPIMLVEQLLYTWMFLLRYRLKWSSLRGGRYKYYSHLGGSHGNDIEKKYYKIFQNMSLDIFLKKKYNDYF